MLTYDLTNGAGPLYARLYQHIKDDIANGVLMRDEKLPSRRALSENLGISTVTVDNAYMQLLDEGYIYALPKKGYYVSNITELFPANDGRSEQKNVADIPAKPSAPSRSDASDSPQNAIRFDFSSNMPDSESFPFSVWAKLVRNTIADHPDDLLKVSDYNGVYELRSAIAMHLSSFRGMNVDPSQIVVGAGTEYLYGLIIKLLGKDKKYCIENPGYRKIRQIYEAEGVDCILGKMDEYGLTPESILKSGANIVHISPTHHFPTGITMPISRRIEILKLISASETGYIIEDDYDSEFRQKGNPIPPLQSIDSSGRVIYMNTFSKSLASTIRMAYMVLPQELSDKYRDELSFYSCTVSTFDQYTLAAFIKNGHFEKHINRMRLQYGKRRKAVLDIIKETLPIGSNTTRQNSSTSGSNSNNNFFKIAENDSGLHFILEITSDLSDKEIEDKLLEDGIRIRAVSDYYMVPNTAPSKVIPPQGRFIIDYSNIDISLLPYALGKLRDAVNI